MAIKQNSRESILETASRLFFKQGYHATGLNQIIKESVCPKGSLYYYFPEGKEELALECISLVKEVVIGKWRVHFSGCEDPVKSIQAFIQDITDEAVMTDFEGFMPFSFWLSVETSCISNRLRSACQDVLTNWQSFVAGQLVRAGMQRSSALETAMVIISLLEGALILAQTNKDKTPLMAAYRHIPFIVKEELESRGK
ncbi:TetR/AcrR family transcriptional regulator [Paenibacillus nasutitermitis]|uniref:HTH-type transcriptional regulator YxaF n=1 Tax=Paenibacillus nasutitermitis TaxID=1652958 RepID=A0A916Z434_9BACL|nr:TetR/AcrR family transcriptional regulator [Paenibacillus nasutitermitis]GGD73596.1 putative HTH-type transcriptional regulator YxaF [Paenibacillus nasutitermitis]